MRGILAISLLLACYALEFGGSPASAASPPRGPPPKARSPPPKAKSPVPKPKPVALHPPPPESNVTCQDRSPQCQQFAAQGYCTSRPVYMVGTATAPGYCQATCKKCPAGTCRDTSTQCASFAAQGCCTSRPVYMIGSDKAPGNCLASCKACVASPPPLPPPPVFATKFFSAPDAGNATIRSMARTTFCMTPNPVGGRTLVFRACDGSDKQLWTWSRSKHTLVNAASKLCVTYNSALAEGSAVNMQACTTPAVSKLQQWSYIPYAINALMPLSNNAWAITLNITGDGVPVAMAKTPKPEEGLSACQPSLFQLFPAKCMDLSPQCPTWAKEGRCKSDPDYMLGDAFHVAACAASCGTCPAYPPSPPPPKPRVNRPPRNGGAQGGGCVSACPAGYQFQTSYRDDYSWTYVTGNLCVRPTQSYTQDCVYNAQNWQALSLCEPCDTAHGYFSQVPGLTFNDDGTIMHQDTGVFWQCVKQSDYTFLCDGPPAEAPVAVGSPPPSPPPPSPPRPPSSPPRPPCDSFCCLFNPVHQFEECTYY